MQDSSSNFRSMVALVCLALVARAAALWVLGGQLSNDPDAYRAIATQLAKGEGFGFPPGNELGTPSAYRPPLYPCLLAPLVKISGDDETLLRRMIGGLQLVLGTVTVWLTCLTANRLAMGRTGYLAGILVAADPLMLAGTAQVMTETTAAFLAALLLWLALGQARDRGGVWLLVGIVFGLCCLCRPTFWALGFLAGAVWFLQQRRPRETAGDSWRQASCVVIGTLVAVAPWLIRNAISMREPILTTTHGGYTLLLGHNPLYTDAVVNRPWGAVWEIDADSQWHDWLQKEMQGQEPPIDAQAPVSPATELARDRWMTRRALQYMREEPVLAARSSLTLLRRLWNVAPLDTGNRNLRPFVRWLIGFSYFATFVAAFAGLWQLTRAEWRTWWPLPVLLVSFTLVHAFYWADMRMRAPLVPAIALLAARGIAGRRVEE